MSDPLNYDVFKIKYLNSNYLLELKMKQKLSEETIQEYQTDVSVISAL